MNSPYLPPGWPAGVRPPGSAEWERFASAFLFDCCPPDFRSHQVLRQHPRVLAQFADHFVAGQCKAAQEGLAVVRTSLEEEELPAAVIEAAAQAWLAEGARLMRTRRAVQLVGGALRGQQWVPKL